MLPHSRFRLPALATAIALALGFGAALALPSPSALAVTPSTSAKLASTIADTLSSDYASPDDALYVATNGSDANAGTADAPFATLAKAMKTVRANHTIVVRGGVYHQGASPEVTGANGGTYYFSPPAGVTIQSAPGETVWFDGTQRVTSWHKVSKNHYTVKWETPDFCGQKYYDRKPSSQTMTGPCSYPDSIGKDASLGDPQMVFRNDKQLTQVSSLSKMKSASKFYYDWSRRTLHIRFNPKTSTVELSRFAQAMALFKPTDFTLRGIGIRRYASNQYGNATGGAVLLNQGSNVRIERSVLTQNAGQGLISWQTSHLTITSSILSGNGYNGLGFDGAWAARGTGTTPTDDLVIEYSRLDGNDTDHYGVHCTYGCGAAGAKITGTYNITLRYNSFSHNGGGRASGFWCDLHCTNLTAYGNVFDGNDRHGLIYEISDTATIASNLFVNNGWHSDAYGGGYGMYIGSADVRIYNNTIVGNRNGVGLYDDARSAATNSGGYDSSRIGADSSGVDFVNNIVSGGSSASGRQMWISGSDVKVAGNTAACDVVQKMASNSYHNPSGGAKYWFVWIDSAGAKTNVLKTMPEVQSLTGQEDGSALSTAKANPYLANPTAGDYTVAPGSSAAGTAEDLPSDIAGLLDVPAAGHDRGVISLQG